MSIVKKTGILLASEIFAKGISFLLIPLYSVVIDPTDFGVIAILQLVFTIFFVLSSFSLKNTFDKFYFDKEIKTKEQLFSNVFLLQLLVLFLSAFVYIYFRNFILKYLEINFGFYLDLVFVTSVISIFYPITSSYLICSGNIKKFGVYAILISLIRSLVALVLVINMHDKILAILLANLIEHSVGLIISVPYYLKYIKRAIIKIQTLKEFFTYSLYYYPTNISNFFVKFSDRIMIQFMLGYQNLGIYSMGTRLVNIPGQFISTINKNFTPQIYLAIKQDNVAQFNNLNKLFLTVVFFLIFGLLIFSPEIFYLIGEKYKKAFHIFIILSISSYINGYNLIIQPAATYFKKFVKYKSFVWMAVGVVNIILNFLFIPKYGIIGAAIATIVSYLISIPFSYFYSVKAYRQKYYLNWFLWSLLLLFIVSFYLIFFKDESSFFNFLIRIIFYILVGAIFAQQIIGVKEIKKKLNLLFYKLKK